jgi:hypothetical protein
LRAPVRDLTSVRRRQLVAKLDACTAPLDNVRADPTSAHSYGNAAPGRGSSEWINNQFTRCGEVLNEMRDASFTLPPLVFFLFPF